MLHDVNMYDYQLYIFLLISHAGADVRELLFCFSKQQHDIVGKQVMIFLMSLASWRHGY